MNSILDLANSTPARKTAEDYYRAHTLSITIWPEAWRLAEVEVALVWESVIFGRNTIEEVPEVRGIYALCISVKDSIMPRQLGPIVYFGETSRTLRKRYQEYVKDSEKGAKRPKLQYLFELWSGDLDFCFAPVADPGIDLKQIEKVLNDAALPIFVTNDFSAEIRRIVAVLRT